MFCPVFPLGLSLLHLAHRFGMSPLGVGLVPTLSVAPAADTAPRGVLCPVTAGAAPWVLSLRNSGAVNEGISSAGESRARNESGAQLPGVGGAWEEKSLDCDFPGCSRAGTVP